MPCFLSMVIYLYSYIVGIYGHFYSSADRKCYHRRYMTEIYAEHHGYIRTDLVFE